MSKCTEKNWGRAVELERRHLCFSLYVLLSPMRMYLFHRKMKGRMYVKDEQQIKMDRQEI